jgi:glycosyltransferase involved in cell wall biosynthesis
VLAESHGFRAGDITVIPHGASANFGGSVSASTPRPAVLTWGLIGPGKGIEHGIAAIAQMSICRPQPHYIVAGQTHPKVFEAEADRYRDSLQELARMHGVDDRVIFDSTYRDWDALRELVRSVDVVLLPYDSRDQVSSGVLVEALASAKPVVATRFPHAVELLGDGAGILVDHGDAAAMSVALHHVLFEPGVAEDMAAVARVIARRDLLWPTVGAAYRSVIAAAIRSEVAA